MKAIADNLVTVRARIAQACADAGRGPGEVALLAVSKTQPAGAVMEAAAAGQLRFAENYIQEAVDKQPACPPGLEWHFIGPLQSNKTAEAARHFAWVHGVDRLKIAQRLSAQRPAGMPPLNICVQVNISGETSKSGCAPAEALQLCVTAAELPNLHLRGLMAIPEPVASGTDPRAPYRQLRELHAKIRSALGQAGARFGAQFDTLSAGMSDDLEAAVAEGSTLVRIGTALFGPRNYK